MESLVVGDSTVGIKLDRFGVFSEGLVERLFCLFMSTKLVQELSPGIMHFRRIVRALIRKELDLTGAAEMEVLDIPGIFLGNLAPTGIALTAIGKVLCFNDDTALRFHEDAILRGWRLVGTVGLRSG